MSDAQVKLDVTVKDILLPSEAAFPDHVWSLLESTRPVKELKGLVLATAPDFAWDPEAERIAGMVADLLDIGVARDVLVKAWNEGGLFARYLNRGRYAPEEVVEVALVDHTVTSKHRPRLEILLNGDPLTPLVLDVTVKVTVQGAVVEIQDGTIRRIRTGTLRGEGDLKWEGFLLASEKSKPVQLPGVKEFGGGGIPIVA
ncbi:MAG: hypothetical protein PVJ02_08390 [Gemmatimonadota bacterium]|jgi:hypothetical protein